MLRVELNLIQNVILLNLNHVDSKDILMLEINYSLIYNKNNKLVNRNISKFLQEIIIILFICKIMNWKITQSNQ